VIFEREADRGQVSQSLVGSPEVILHQPLGQVAVENHGLGRHIAEADELVLQRPVEPLVERMVLGCFDPGPAMRRAESLAGYLKVAVELRSVISLNILNLTVKQDVQAVEEMQAQRRAVRGIHPGKGHLGVPIFGGVAPSNDSRRTRSGSGDRSPTLCQ
jgi:hypothetical protein